jgi:prepilin-type N-terminal cleavage/methylation domain-containing protein
MKFEIPKSFYCHKGFSLMELMVALALIGIAIAMAAPSNNPMSQRVKLQTYKVQLRDALQQARNLARTRQECVTVDIQTQQITIKTYKMPAPCSAPFINLDTTVVQSFDSAVSLQPFTVANPFVFNDHGGTDYNGVSQMQLQAYGQTSTFSVYSLTGQVRTNGL